MVKCFDEIISTLTNDPTPMPHIATLWIHKKSSHSIKKLRKKNGHSTEM